MSKGLGLCVHDTPGRHKVLDFRRIHRRELVRHNIERKGVSYLMPHRGLTWVECIVSTGKT